MFNLFHIHMERTTFAEYDYQRAHASKRHNSVTELTAVVDYLTTCASFGTLFKNLFNDIHSAQMHNHNFIFMKQNHYDVKKSVTQHTTMSVCPM